jgi:hypothetical protein
MQTMGKTLDLGQRIELQSADKHCHDISLGLYRRDVGGRPRVYVHSYSSAPGVEQRVAFIRKGLVAMLGLEACADDAMWLQFSCNDPHERALKRGFLDLCKLETGAALEPKPLTAPDKKAGCDLSAVSLGNGVYETRPMGQTDTGARRAEALVRGFVKVCEMQEVEGASNRIAFPCGMSHDALIGMLMFRAQNVRASMAEQEAAAARGVLAAPSQQR